MCFPNLKDRLNMLADVEQVVQSFFQRLHC